MKTILTTIKDTDAQKQVKIFSTVGVTLSVVSLVAFWWLAIAGLAFSSRALLLTWHQAVKEKSLVYRIINTTGALVGLVSIINYFA